MIIEPDILDILGVLCVSVTAITFFVGLFILIYVLINRKT